jgi:hypothetical protein
MGFKTFFTEKMAERGKFRDTETGETVELSIEQYCMKVDKTMLEPLDDDAKRIVKNAGKHDQRS